MTDTKYLNAAIPDGEGTTWVVITYPKLSENCVHTDVGRIQPRNSAWTTPQAAAKEYGEQQHKAQAVGSDIGSIRIYEVDVVERLAKDIV